MHGCAESLRELLRFRDTVVAGASSRQGSELTVVWRENDVASFQEIRLVAKDLAEGPKSVAIDHQRQIDIERSSHELNGTRSSPDPGTHGESAALRKSIPEFVDRFGAELTFDVRKRDLDRFRDALLEHVQGGGRNTEHHETGPRADRRARSEDRSAGHSR